MGSLYRRGDIWWVSYYVNWKQVRETAGTTKESEAKRILKECKGKVATGQPILHRADRITYEEIAGDLRQYYMTTAARNLEEAEYRLKHLDKYFAGKRVAQIGSADVTAYARHRQREGAANATINHVWLAHAVRSADADQTPG